MFIQGIAMKVKNSTSLMIRVVALIGIIAAVAVPFLMLTVGGREASRLPWYVWTIVPVFLLMVLAVGFLLFRHESHAAADISIRPRSR